ncbi:adenylosuccinate lyase family protein [Pseudooceanicola sp. CBS1P-1]|uniref:Adenylosuccinate lyase family protein n=1 Tax=Pseudooceanicola albus TaxID=2692189 RepID=A0A6L7GBM1_9RHOB|nr:MULTISPECIES: lyase family protein [Pseudooceanicola]MBT9384519.1 adenylosuccinate lyase family protein [Pseudooceanicola endophyticus]MXN21102.1 adenylosuccinate lyase family protein [Pseudooceanicola albus]
MAGSVHDSTIYSKLFDCGEAGRLFTDSAEVRSMVIVEGALAKAQGALGIIPELSAKFIHRASLELPIDPSGLNAGAAKNGVPVPGLVSAFRKAMEAPEHAQFVHWGATSQDIADTGQMLRLRQLLLLCEDGLKTLLKALATQAEAHADLPMAGRTYGQFATPVSFGSHVAGWGWPLFDLLAELEGLRKSSLWVSLSGAAGTGAEFGEQRDALRAALAEGLGLGDPGRSWHADRGPVLRIAGWLTRLAQILGKMGDDLILMAQSSAGEVRLGASGGSSTMPQKQNPVQPSVLLALARQVIGLNAIMQGAGMPRQERDGAAWFTEWMTLPQLCLSAHAALVTANALVPGLKPQGEKMAEAFSGSQGLLHAEALSFRLARSMPRPEAQDAVKALALEVLASGRTLGEMAREKWPDLDLSGLFAPEEQMGDAPATARRFAAAVAAL